MSEPAMTPEQLQQLVDALAPRLAQELETRLTNRAELLASAVNALADRVASLEASVVKLDGRIDTSVARLDSGIARIDRKIDGIARKLLHPLELTALGVTSGGSGGGSGESSTFARAAAPSDTPRR